jgi:hypothetical protein
MEECNPTKNWYSNVANKDKRKLGNYLPEHCVNVK